MRFYNESKHNIKKRHLLEKCLPNIKNSNAITGDRFLDF